MEYTFRLVSHRNKYIYHQLPKCGSRSIREVIVPRLYDEYGGDYRGARPMWRDVLRDIPKAHFNDSYDDYDDYFKWTVVRNPYHRVVSAYVSRVGGSGGLYRPDDFTEFVRELLPDGRNYYYPMKPPEVHLIPWSELHDHYHIDKFYRLENGLRQVFRDLNIELDAVPHRYNSGVEDYMSYYDSKSTQIVNQIYREDFDIFGYEVIE